MREGVGSTLARLDNAEKEPVLRVVARSLRRRWALIIVFTALSALGAFALTTQQDRLYEARASVYVAMTSEDSVQSAVDIYAGSLSSVERARSFVPLASSDAVLDRAVTSVRPRLTVEEARDSLRVSVEAGTVVIDVEATRTDRSQAAQLADSTAAALTAYVTETEKPAVSNGSFVKIVPVDAAAMPKSAVFPDPTLQITLAAAAALLFACGVAVATDRLGVRIRRPADFTGAIDVPLLGEIPFEPSMHGQTVVDFTKSSAPIIEAFRKVRTALRYVGIDNPARVIVISSPVAGEGKSVTAVNLALALAAVADQRVVLLDANLRHPSIHEGLGIDRAGGLTDALRTDDPLAVVQPTSVARLSAVTAGAALVDKSHILSTEKAASFLELLRAHFDFVVVDTSAVNSDADVAMVAAAADGVVLVARAGVTHDRDLAEAIEDLGEVSARVLGVVLNGTTEYDAASHGIDDSAISRSVGR